MDKKNKQNIHAGHRQKLKARFLKDGIENFEPHVIMELLLYYGIPYKDTNPLGHELINKYGSINNVLDAPFEDLVKINGISDNTATLIKLVQALSVKYAKNKMTPGTELDTSEKAGKYIMSKFLMSEKEKFGIVGIDSHCRVVDFAIVSEGSINATEVSLPLVIETAVKRSWTSIILCHNHPSGSLLPSNQDISTTMSLVKALKMVGVKVVDHIIVNNTDYVAMSDIRDYAKIFK